MMASPSLTRSTHRGETRQAAPARFVPWRPPVVMVFIAGLGLATLAIAQAPVPLVILNARLLDVTAGRSRPVAALVVEGQKISSIHQKQPETLPEPNRTIDAGGATIVPPLADLAVQAMPGGALDVDYYYAMSLAHGVMRVRTVDIRLPWASEQVARVARGDVLGPRLWTTGPALDMRTPLGNRARPVLAGGLSPIVQVSDPAGAAREVTRQASQGAGWVRLASQVPPDIVRRAVAAARVAKVKVSLTPWATSMGQAARLGVSLIDSLGSPAKPPADQPPPPPNVADPHAVSLAGAIESDVGIDAAWASLSAGDQRTLAAELARSRTPVSPRLFELALVAGKAEAAFDISHMPESTRRDLAARASAGDPKVRQQAFERALAFVKALHDAGGVLATASGTGPDGWPTPGLGIHRELQWLVTAGLTPAEALRAATASSGAVLGERLAAQWRPGAPADFFAVKGDPLADLAALTDITLIVRGGEVLDRAALLAQARRATRH